MKRIDEIIKSLNKYPNDIWWLETIQKIIEKDLSELEKKINYKFPKDFRYFLLKYNWISIPWEYVYWIKKDTSKILPIDIYNNYITEHDKKIANPMPKYLVPFSPNGRWDHYCFNKKDNKIYFWQHDCSDYSWNPNYECDIFTEWLENSINESLEVLLED